MGEVLIVVDLPAPKSSYLDRLRAKPEPATEEARPSTPPQPASPAQEPKSVRSRRSRRDSLGGLEADPWGSPDMHRGHGHPPADPAGLNGYGSVRSGTNTWSSKPIAGSPQGGEDTGRPNGQTDSTITGAEGWGGGLDNTPAGEPGQAGLGGFGLPGDGDPNSNPQRRSLGVAGSTNPRVEEVVTVTLLPEKEGVFMFQHRNYEVKSTRRASTVVRRYSDFVWLLECLQKRYPFRQLPLLPPKRLAGT